MTGFAADRARRVTETDRWLASLLGEQASVALVAVGGYGRRELLLGSDLDVVLLHDGRPDISALADRIWYPVWDSGTRLDHAVRTPVRRGPWPAPTCGWRWGCCLPGMSPAMPNSPPGSGSACSPTGGPRPVPGWPNSRPCITSAPGAAVSLPSCSSPTSRRPGAACATWTRSSAIAAAWVAPGPGPRVRAAHDLLLDARHALHEVTGRAMDRLVLQEQDEVARLLELADADALLRGLAGAGRTVAYALDQSFRQAQRSRAGGQAAGRVRITLPGVKLTRPARRRSARFAARSPRAWSSRTGRWCSPGPPIQRPIRC